MQSKELNLPCRLSLVQRQVQIDGAGDKAGALEPVVEVVRVGHLGLGANVEQVLVDGAVGQSGRVQRVDGGDGAGGEGGQEDGLVGGGHRAVRVRVSALARARPRLGELLAAVLVGARLGRYARESKR